MLHNPFTPSSLATSRDDFFGRQSELDVLARSLHLGSVAIQGAVGIGKSSLMGRCLQHLKEHAPSLGAKAVTAVVDRDTTTVDDLAARILSQFVSVDEKQQTFSLSIPKILEMKSADITRHFVSGRHMEALERILATEAFQSEFGRDDHLVIGIDEGDKCPVAIARFVRRLLTSTELRGRGKIRFIVAGVSPFYHAMVSEDPGISRFFYKSISLQPMDRTEAEGLLEFKFELVEKSASKYAQTLDIAPGLIGRVVDLAGGHPHLLQLLGAHLVEHEDEDPDGEIDSRDLVTSLRKICYEDRARVYDSTLHALTIDDKLDTLVQLLRMSKSGFPTRIDRHEAADVVDGGAIRYLVDRDILSVNSPDEYGLVDEFLRIRLLLDAAESDDEMEAMEERILADKVPALEDGNELGQDEFEDN